MDSIKTTDYSEILNHIWTSSSPSASKITDIKICKVDLPPWGRYLIRIDTNQGVSGYGETRDGASASYVKLLKSRLVGENFCEVNRLFRKIKQFGGSTRQSSGVCAVELTLWNLAGKVYGVPAYQMLGGRSHDKVRFYDGTHAEEGRFTGKIMDPKDVGSVLKGYMDKDFTMSKLLSVELLMTQEGNYCGPLDWVEQLRAVEEKARNVALYGSQAEIFKVNGQLYDLNRIPHPLTNMRVTEQELDRLESYTEEIRSIIGYKALLAIDRLGHSPLNDMIKIARRLERFDPARLEDMLPWYLMKQHRILKQSTTVSLVTGEDIYLAENFELLLAAGGIDMVHPDILISGGILETKKLGDLAARYGASMAVHTCESPITSLAVAHVATANENFFALEYDAFDSSWWEDIIDGPVKSVIEQGFMSVTDAPGLGIVSLNEDMTRGHGPIKEKDIWMFTDDRNGGVPPGRIWS